jgi:Zn-dependent M16 (insulinase) family peptidase
LDSELVASSLKRARFKQLEIPGGMPNGLRALNRSLRGWIFDLGPSATIQSAPLLEELERKLQENPRYFEDGCRSIHRQPHRWL